METRSWKKCVLVTFMILGAQAIRAQDPITLIIKEGIKKAIQAADLHIQRQQNKVIWLQNAQKVLENTLTKWRLDEITGWVEKQKEIYSTYYEELWKVKNALTYYHEVKLLMERQVLLVKEYKRAMAGVKKDKHFSSGEVLYMGKVYAAIMEESIRSLNQVSVVLRSFTTQMSDAARLRLIREVSQETEGLYADLKQFTQRNVQLSLSRAKDAHSIDVLKRLYGIK